MAIKTSAEITREILRNERPRWDCQANDQIIIAATDDSINRSRIRAVIDELANAGKLVQNPAVTEALTAAKGVHPFYNFDVLAFEKRVLDQAEYCHFSITSARDLSDVMDWVLANDQVPLTAAGEAAQVQQRGVEQRTRQINEITNDYKSGFKIRTPNGGVKVYDRDGYEIQFSSAGGRAKPRNGGFDAMTDDEVHAIYQEVVEQRRLQGLSKEELRAEINPVRQQKYEASSTSLGPNPAGTVLVNPDTGDVISDKRSLIRFINQHPNNTKRLIQRRGETDKTLAREFERILNS